uniref:TF-B3 domain-containing protein n=1 Tax=Brassica oleracea TaxID=3712 RepID=A0A3P6CUD9_BRAOL|nr:unnamed protein product [Brassica oleracea]
MVTHDDDKLSEGEKKCFDLFATLLLAFGDDEIRAKRGQDRNLLMIHTAATTLLSGKRKIEDDDQENTLVESDDEPIRAQPIREIKTPVREINRPVNRKAPVRREPVRREPGETPGWVVELMKTFKGREGDAKMIFEKAMTKTDLAPNQGRLLMPFYQMAEMDFLNEAELKILEEHHKGDYVKKGVDVILLNRSGKKRWNLNMRIWKMNTCFNYALCTGWNQVVLDNTLQRNQTITLWSFHSLDGTLYFAFDPPTPALALVPVTHAASSSSMDTVVISEDPFVCEEANRRLYPFPKRRTTPRVCVPPPTSDSSKLRL